MTTTFARVTAFALAAAVTIVVFSGANGLAAQQFSKADAIAMSQGQVLAAQTVVIVGHRA